MAEFYPRPRAGQKVTGALLESMLPRTARKTSDSTYTSTTGANDSELVISVEANAIYEMNGIIFCNNTTADSDIVIDYDAPVGTDGTWSGVGRATNTAGTQEGSAKMVGTAVTASRSFGTDDFGSSAPTVVQIAGIVIVGGTSGNYTVQFGLLNAGGTLTIYTDSYVTLRRIG